MIQNSQKPAQALPTQTINMFKMFAIICAVTVYECNTMYEDPPRTFATKQECIAAATIKEKQTREFFLDEDGYLSITHLEVGCEEIPNKNLSYF